MSEGLFCKYSKHISSAILCSMLIGSSGQGAVVVIDSFNEPDPGNTHTSQGQAAFNDVTTCALGGNRDGSVGCESSELDGTTSAKIANGELEVYTNKKASPSVYFAYDSTVGWGSHLDTDPFNGAFSTAVDLTDDGSNDSFSFLFTYAGGDDGVTPFFNDLLVTLKIKDEADLYQINLGNNGTDAANVWMDENYATLNGGTPVAFDVSFNEFSGSPDLTKVEALAFHICSNNSDAEYKLDGLTAQPLGGSSVPESQTFALALLGVILLRILRTRPVSFSRIISTS